MLTVLGIKMILWNDSVLVIPLQMNQIIKVLANRMPRIYARFGYFVGLHPSKFIFLGLLFSSLSFGMFFIHLRDNVRDGYTPTTSRARKESDILRQFMNSSSN